MSESRKIRAKRSVITTLMLQVTLIICGLIIPRLLMSTYGSEAYGATTSITQFLSYITLLEGGIGGVARASLYKPLADNDTERISVVMCELQFFFRVLAYISIAYAIILALVFKYISHIEIYDWISTALLVLAMAVSTFGQYFIGISYSALIQADQRVYIVNGLSILTTVLNTIFVVILVQLGSGLILVKFISSCVYLIKPTIMWLYVRKHYGLQKIKKRDSNALSQKWTGLGQHIAYYIHSNTDVAILTIMENLKAVSVYSLYSMVTNNIQNVVNASCSGMGAMFGDMIARDEKDNLDTAFDFYETMTSVVCTVLFSTVYIMILSFVKLYTKGITDTNYDQPLFAILLTTAALVYCIRIPYLTIITSAGHYRQTRWGAYGEAVINILVSVCLVYKFGLIGVAIGTVAAMGFRLVYCVIYLSKNILNRSTSVFIKRSVVTGLNILLICLICNNVIRRVMITNYLIWVYYSLGTVIVAGICAFLTNIALYRKETVRVLKSVIRKKSDF